MKKIRLFGAVLLIILLTIGVIFVMRGQVMNPKYVALKEVDVTNNTIIMKGHISDSSHNYVGYQTHYKHGTLYIKIKARMFLRTKDQGTIDAIIENEYSGLKEIKLVSGDSRTSKTIWSN